ncbi:MAG TPA: phosphotransferase family protein [Acidimicrobiales bacterium]|nr:phosphotransferase family protein [Acidimicrobiales bacterium]
MTDEPPASTTPWRRDPREIEAGLGAWARSRYGNGARLTDVRAPDSGMANDTVMFRVDNDALVARLAPVPTSPYPTFPTYDLALQQQVIELVRERTVVPVPEVVHVEHTGAWLGVPFMVVRAVEGFVPSDNPPYLLDPNGWFMRGTPADWARLEESTINVLVQLHRVRDGEELSFLHLDAPGPTHLARQLASHRAFYEWARDGHTVPVLEQAFDVLSATLPRNDRAVLNWGDSRPGNIIYRDFRPVAVLDWEMAAVGPPEADVGWLTFFQRFWADMAAGYGLPPVPAMFGRVETAATYERLSGDRLEDLAWYEALAGLRLGIIAARMSLRSIAFGLQERPADPDDLVMHRRLLQRLLADL